MSTARVFLGPGPDTDDWGMYEDEVKPAESTITTIEQLDYLMNAHSGELRVRLREGTSRPDLNNLAEDARNSGYGYILYFDSDTTLKGLGEMSLGGVVIFCKGTLTLDNTKLNSERPYRALDGTTASYSGGGGFRRCRICGSGPEKPHVILCKRGGGLGDVKLVAMGVELEPAPLAVPASEIALP